MSVITQLGQINTTALSVPDLYVQIVPPQNIVPPGQPSNVLGVVGTATWGPVNQPVIVGNPAGYTLAFGQIQPRKYDMGTAVAIAQQQGAAAFRCVRVTDGTDLAASASVQTNALTVTALWTGALGNSVAVTFLPGARAGTTAVQVTCPGFPSERFDNIAGSGNALWAAIAAALNSGVGTTRGPSALVTAAAGAGTAAPVLGTPVPLTGGTDGASGVTAATLVGQDTLPRKGMYCLRAQGTGVFLLADADDATQWVVQGGFALSEATYGIAVSPAGSAIANGTTGTVDLKASAGLDNYGIKLMHGDWVWWNDQVNQQVRLVSPQAFVAGRLANLSPEQSSLNKPLYGVVGTQKSGQPGSGSAGAYASADLQALFQAGVDVIANPAPGGGYWTTRRGCNTSSNPAVNGDNYTRLTNYIATSIAAISSGIGTFVGQVITPSLMQRYRSAFLSFFSNMAQQGQLSSPDGSTPYSVVCDLTNNPGSRTSLGYLQADAQAVFGPIALFLTANVQGGQTVTIQRQTTQAGQVVN